MNITTAGIGLAKNLLSDTQHREAGASRLCAVEKEANSPIMPMQPHLSRKQSFHACRSKNHSQNLNLKLKQERFKRKNMRSKIAEKKVFL